MDAYLRPLIFMPYLGEIEKVKKYTQKNVYIRTAYNSLCVCV